jgi:hypothetical protein
MTDIRFKRYYNAARAAAIEARSLDFTTRRLGKRRLEQALDLLALEVDGVQGYMVEWASANGWPEFETIERYGLVTP